MLTPLSFIVRGEESFQGMEISRFIACFQFKANKNSKIIEIVGDFF
jgi:hypothetical protein